MEDFQGGSLEPWIIDWLKPVVTCGAFDDLQAVADGREPAAQAQVTALGTAAEERRYHSGFERWAPSVRMRPDRMRSPGERSIQGRSGVGVHPCSAYDCLTVRRGSFAANRNAASGVRFECGL